jgi:hypothetical protein
MPLKSSLWKSLEQTNSVLHFLIIYKSISVRDWGRCAIFCSTNSSGCLFVGENNLTSVILKRENLQNWKIDIILLFQENRV